ncbi:hypothetical protein LINGRAHAP2_LOCUS21848 [Linum grandiflorum]
MKTFTATTEMEEEIKSASVRCKRVIERVGRLPPSTNITESCKRTLLKLANSELNFLSRSSSSLDSSPPPPLSVNIGHLEAVVHILEQPFVTGVSRVCKRVSLAPPGARNGDNNAPSGVVHVDIVCTLNKKPVWIIVSDRNPSYVYWHGYRRDKGLKLRIEQVIAAAARSTKTMKPRSIVLFFPRGVGRSVSQNLEDEFGACKFHLGSYREASSFEIKLDSSDEYPVNPSNPACLQGLADEEHQKLKPDDDDAFRSLISRIKTRDMESSDDDILNYSTTALIGIVSGISNGCAEKLLATPEYRLRQQFKGNTEFVIGQANLSISLSFISPA